MKGAREALRIFMLEGPVSPSTVVRNDRGLGASPLVGRDKELAALEDALATAVKGEAQAVGIVGEAGAGKSRLCEEFARSATARGVRVRHTAGLSHGRDIPLLPILGLLRHYFSITEADNAEQAREKITRCLVDLDPALEDALPLVYDFLEVAHPQRPLPKLTPEVRMRRIFEALRQVTQRRSGREVLILVAEDLHWFDSQSKAFFERLIESLPVEDVGSGQFPSRVLRPLDAPLLTTDSYRLPRLPLCRTKLSASCWVPSWESTCRLPRCFPSCWNARAATHSSSRKWYGPWSRTARCLAFLGATV